MLYGIGEGNACSYVSIIKSPFEGISLDEIKNNMPYTKVGYGSIYEPRKREYGEWGIETVLISRYGVEYNNTQYVLADCIMEANNNTHTTREIRLLTMIVVESDFEYGDWSYGDIKWDSYRSGHGKKVLVSNMYGEDWKQVLKGIVVSGINIKRSMETVDMITRMHS